MKTTTRTTLMLLLGALSVACSGPPGSVDSPENAPVATDSGPAQGAVCGLVDTLTGARPRIFQFSAMNHKLTSFPDFAAYAGLDSVSDCEGVERYLDAFAEYVEANPNFDDEEPTDDLPDLADPPMPPASPASLEAQKVYKGAEALNNPVVQISYSLVQQPGAEDITDLFGFGAGSCSGTFIAKNWILTAGHCITDAAIFNCLRQHKDPKTDPTCKPEFNTYGLWTIDFTLPDRTLLKLERVLALAYTNPMWIGNDATKNPLLRGGGNLTGLADNDVALLYIGDDSVLPPRVEDDGAKRLSMVPPVLSGTSAWTLQAFGWGAPGADELRSFGGIGPTTYQMQGTRAILADSAAATQAALCPGDSGGPLVRMDTSIRTNTSGNDRRSVQVVVGVDSLVGISKADCTGATLSGSRRQVWANVAHNTNLDFIKKMIRRWNGNPITLQSGFNCREREVWQGSTQGTIKEVLECWGFPCERDLDCNFGADAGVYCSRPGRNFSSCPTCEGQPPPPPDSPNGPCGCMVGQCLSDPRSATPDPP